MLIVGVRQVGIPAQADAVDKEDAVLRCNDGHVEGGCWCENHQAYCPCSEPRALEFFANILQGPAFEERERGVKDDGEEWPSKDLIGSNSGYCLLNLVGHADAPNEVEPGVHHGGKDYEWATMSANGITKGGLRVALLPRPPWMAKRADLAES